MDESTAAGVAGLARLPEEILLLIFTHLQPTVKSKSWKPYDDHATVLYQSLSRLCRVNTLCERIATPLLYNTVELPGVACSNAGAPSENDLETSERPVQLFTRAIGSDPGLALLVRKMKFDYHGREQVPRLAYDGPLEMQGSVLDYLLMLLPVTFALKDKIRQRALEFGDDAMLAMLLPLCVNLRYLDITFYDHPQSFDESLLLQTIGEVLTDLDGGGCFRSLETLRLRQTHKIVPLDEEPGVIPAGYGLVDIEALLRLPALKNLRCRNVGRLDWANFSPDYKPLEPKLSLSLVSVHLTSSLLSGKEIAEIFPALPSLREFKYTEREPCLMDSDHEMIFEALQHHGKKLRTLQLYACNTGGPPGSLKPLARLKELAIAQRSLFGCFDPENLPLDEVPELTDVLPESLMKVKIIPFHRSYPAIDIFAPPQTEEEWNEPRHACTDFGEAFDDRIIRLCQDARFGTLGKITLKRADEIEKGIVPKGWVPEVDEKGWVRVRRGKSGKEGEGVEGLIDPFEGLRWEDFGEPFEEVMNLEEYGSPETDEGQVNGAELEGVGTTNAG